MEDIQSSELIYLLISDNGEYKTSYDKNISNHQLVETMVVDMRHKLTDKEMNDIDSYLNHNFIPKKPSNYDMRIKLWMINVRHKQPLDFPFYWFHDGIHDYLKLSDEPEQLPNFDIIKHWKHVYCCNDYECFQSEWLNDKHTMPKIVYEPLVDSKFTTVSHLLARRCLDWDDEWMSELIDEYVPEHKNELSMYDILGKKPVEWIANFITNDEKKIFEENM